MPAVEFRVYDRNSGSHLTSLASANDRRCQDVDNDTGSGGVTLGLADADLGHMVEGNIVRCFVDGVVAYSWVVGPMDQSTIAPSEEQAEERRISGRGTLGLWADGIVYPEMGGSGVTFPPLHERRVVDVRRFDFAAVGYDDSGWAGAVVVPPPPALEPLDGTPSGWPLESQDWIWSRPRSGTDHPPGHSYFRHQFSVGAATQASIYITADNGFELFLDGEMLLSELRTPLLWPFSRSVQVDLLPGTHLIAVKAVNHDVPTAPFNPAGVAMVVVALDTSGDPTSVITTTGAGWKCVDYPAEPPGMTVGRILTNLYNEARARGALSGLTLGFSPTHDSAGIAWPNAPDVALPVGDDYLQVLRKLSELYCDVAMDPGSLRLDAWVSRGTNRSGSVTFSVGTNITALSHKGGEQARTSAILGRFGDHWLERTGGGRRQEKFLEMGSATSSAQAQRMTDAALAERSLPIITTTTGLEPTAGTVPWVHFKVGDQVSVPNAGGATVPGRVKSISVSETIDDYDFVVEVGSMESELLDRLQRMARKAGHGALDGNFANATASTGSEGATDPTGGYLTSATPDLSLNSLTDVASVWEESPAAGDFLGWNPDLGMAGMWEPTSVVQEVGTTVVVEQDFGLAPDPGISSFPSAEDHTHGTPLPRHPQEGYPYVDFGTGAVLLGVTEGEHSPAFLGAEDVGTYMRSFFTSPTGADGWGRAAIDLHGTDDGTAVVKVYNDYAGGLYGAGGTPSAPFSFQLEGDLTLLTIANTPPVAPGGQARIYYNPTAGKAQISENGSPYRDIGGSDLDLGVTVVAEQSFGQVTDVGDSLTAAHADHSHGSPLPRHPQTGYPFVDFGVTHGLLAFGRISSEHGPGMIGTEDVTDALRLFVTSPLRTDTSGRSTASFVGKTNGNATLHLYNDLDVSGNYGAGDGSASKPFSVELEGDLTVRTIANTPPVANAGQARIYYRPSTNKLVVSENGGAYVDLVGGGGGSDVGTGAAGTFLISDPAGTNGRRWTANTEVLVSSGNLVVPGESGRSLYTWYPADANWRIGMSASPGFTRAIATGHVQFITYYTAAGQGFAVGANDGVSSFELRASDHQAYFRGNVGIGVTNPDHKLQVAGGNVKIDGYIWPTLLTVRTTRPSLDGGFFGVENVTAPPAGTAPYERTYITSPKAAVGWGVGVLDLRGHNDGTAGGVFYNDLDINNNYGAGDGSASKPFKLGLSGTFEFETIANNPAVAPAGTARLYYHSTLQQLVISQNGSSYAPIRVDVGNGAAGTVLVTNAAGTGRRWTDAGELFVDFTNQRVGIGASAPQERLSVRNGTAGLISTFFGPIGFNSIAVGNDKTTDNSLQIAYNDTGNYGYLNVWGATSGGLYLENTGSVAIGTGVNEIMRIDASSRTLFIKDNDTNYMEMSMTNGIHFRSSASFRDAYVQGSSQTLFLYGPVVNSGGGQSAIHLLGHDGGNAEIHVFNRRKTDGTYPTTNPTTITNTYILFHVLNGDLKANTTLYTSARESKTNIRDDDKDSLGIINRLRKRQWDRNGHQMGFVADEVAAIDSDLVSHDGQGKPTAWKAVEMTAHLVGGVQTLAERCDELERQNADLTARLDALAA